MMTGGKQENQARHKESGDIQKKNTFGEAAFSFYSSSHWFGLKM